MSAQMPLPVLMPPTIPDRERPAAGSHPVRARNEGSEHPVALNVPAADQTASAVPAENATIPSHAEPSPEAPPAFSRDYTGAAPDNRVARALAWIASRALPRPDMSMRRAVGDAIGDVCFPFALNDDDTYTVADTYNQRCPEPADAATLRQWVADMVAAATQYHRPVGERLAESAKRRGPTALALAVAERMKEEQELCVPYRGSWYVNSCSGYRPLGTDKAGGDEFVARVDSHLAAMGEEITRGKSADVVHNLRRILSVDRSLTAPFRKNEDGSSEELSECITTTTHVVRVGHYVSEMHAGRQPRGYAIPLSQDLFSPVDTDYPYDAEATCPRFEAFIATAQPNQEDRNILQMIAGLCLVPDNSYNVFLVLYDAIGGAGKSVYVNLLRRMIGSRRTCRIPLKDLGNRFGLGRLATCLLNADSELPTKDMSDRSDSSVEALLKAATSGDPITVEEKYCEAYDAIPTARHIFATNTIPYLSDKSNAIWDRMRIVEFSVPVRGTDADDPGLEQFIADNEMPGVLNWAMRGLSRLRRLRFFPEHSNGVALKNAHRVSCNAEASFLSEEVEITGDPDDAVDCTVLYTTYCSWCKTSGYKPRNKGNFAKAVAGLGLVKARVMTDGDRRFVFRGARFMPSTLPPAPVTGSV